ncbi:MAG: metal-dependent hydrolase [Bacteroidetes bacterium]|nr:metal-dependent hydrolase [Bacteroidota bacterium]PTM16380.1 MAG: metal-dependent hydrolase [Bacteroidota bacterium]PTM20243.1 MAG: metal-dependent hydrolase [Bacteroidota bacterium]
MENQVQIWWLGHSAFRLTSPNGHVIYVDPFLSQNPAAREEDKHPGQADFILLTHGHEDHVGDTLEIAKETGCKVVAQVELCGLLKKHGLPADQAVEFNKGGTVHFDDFSVTLVSANHSSSFGGEYAGEAGGLVISFDEDICFYHMGDTNIFADLELYGELYEPTVVAVPIGDTYTMGPQEAALCVEMLGAEVAIPMHYGTFPVLTGDPDEFREFTEEYCDTRVVIAEPGEKVWG